jgi:mannose-6-phosphate isomerase-like protein (cupin superfamily)
MTAVAAPVETRWFTDTRVSVLVAEDTYSLIRFEVQAGGMPPLHVHHGEDEIFYVLRGLVSMHVPDSSVEIGPGEAAFGPRGVPHTYRVESEDGAEILVAATSGAFAAFVAETSVPAEGDGFAPDGILPAPPELAAAASRHGIELLGPPGTLPS